MNRYQHACYLNARSLLRSSKLLFEKRLYGPSSALSVLAIEECGKGFILMFETPNKNNKSHIRKKISDHKNKLLVAAKDAYLMGLMHEGFIKEETIHSIKEFQDKMYELSKNNKKFVKMVAESYLIQSLNPLKKNGLYVDFDGDKIISPKSIKKKGSTICIEAGRKSRKIFSKNSWKIRGI